MAGLAVDAARGVGSGVTAVASTVVQSTISALIFGSFNPTYNKLNQKRMRYIQQKYAQAYGNGGTVDEFDAIIKRIDPNSRLRMVEEGARPANPFPNEKAFEESLEISYYPVSGHQGRFAASHALKCQGKITEYQIQRRKRYYVPGVQSAGRPNDYINLFLDEIKQWLSNQLTLDAVESEELRHRAEYFAKLKRDNYYWCFPEEGGQFRLQEVVDFVHQTVEEALEIVSREEKNKSLQQMFKELNDNTNNAFEYGKNFLAHLTTISKKVGADVMSSKVFDGDTFEAGKLHRMLLVTTDPIMKSYVVDMASTDKRIESGNVGYMGAGAQQALEDKTEGGGNPLQLQQQEQLKRLQQEYTVDVPSYVEGTISSTVFNIDIRDPKGHRWVVGKTFNDLQALHKAVSAEFEALKQPLTLPPNLPMKGLRKAEDYEDRAVKMGAYIADALFALPNLSSEARKHLSKFLDTRELVVPSSGGKTIVFAEAIGNPFLRLKTDFMEQLIGGGGGRGVRVAGAMEGAAEATPQPVAAGSKKAGMNKDLTIFKQAWGVEWVIKILDAYSLLQRMATVLAWTLEINHFFLSMFGNTLSFSKLPLREIVATQKEILTAFSSSCSELFKYACHLHADQQYKWHKNLQAAEHQLEMLQHHIDKAVATICRIETDHLEYETQMRRLQDVASRFQPLMNRVGGSLPAIQQELGLTLRFVSGVPEGSAGLQAGMLATGSISPQQELHAGGVLSEPNPAADYKRQGGRFEPVDQSASGQVLALPPAEPKSAAIGYSAPYAPSGPVIEEPDDLKPGPAAGDEKPLYRAQPQATAATATATAAAQPYAQAKGAKDEGGAGDKPAAKSTPPPAAPIAAPAGARGGTASTGISPKEAFPGDAANSSVCVVS